MKCTNLYIRETYQGVLEGLPSRESRLSYFIQFLERNWGKRKCLLLGDHVFPATTSEFGSDNLPPLPRYQCGAWLNFPTDDWKKGDGKELIIIWFSDDPPEKGFNLEAILKGVNAFEEAEYFEH